MSNMQEHGTFSLETNGLPVLFDENDKFTSQLPKFNLIQGEIDLFKRTFSDICFNNNEIIKFCMEFINFHSNKSYQNILFLNLQSHSISVNQMCEFYKYKSTFSYEYFKFIQFLYQVLLKVLNENKESSVNFVLFINNRIIPYLFIINDQLIKINYNFEENSLDEMFSTELSPQDQNFRITLLINSLNEYLISNNLHLLKHATNDFTLEQILNIYSNLIV